jgi:hypothetical protein
MRALAGITVFCTALFTMPARVGFDCRTIWNLNACNRTPGCGFREVYFRKGSFDPRKEGCFPSKETMPRRVRLLCIDPGAAKLRACDPTDRLDAV